MEDIPFWISEEQDKKNIRLIKEIVEKWSKTEYVDKNLRHDEKLTLSVLLDNTEKYMEMEISSKLKNKQLCDNKLSLDQTLWITKEAWNRSKLKRMVAHQPMLFPTQKAFQYYESHDTFTVKECLVQTRTCKYDFLILETGFEYVKEAYANMMANEIDLLLLELLEKCDGYELAETIKNTELKTKYDYIITDKNTISKIKENNSCDGVDFVTIKTTPDPKTFSPICVAGKYPESSIHGNILLPYLLYITIPSKYDMAHGLVWRFAVATENQNT